MVCTNLLLFDNKIFNNFLGTLEKFDLANLTTSLTVKNELDNLSYPQLL